MLRKDEEAGRIHNVISILVLQAKAYAQAKHTTAAMKVLERAVTLAEPAGYVRVFVNEGAPLQALLAKMLSAIEPSQAAYIGKLLAAFPQPLPQVLDVKRVEKVATKAAPTSSSVLLEPLSGREQEVLELLAAGMANQEIAKRLVVTVGTVKTHIKSIYGKLGVHSRTQAIARARELGLL
jgi:LuxR family transcriptional regulator, maltose regulon positive regulatory protein